MPASELNVDFGYDARAGVTIPDAQDCVDWARGMLSDVFGEDLSEVAPESPLGRFAEALGLLRRAVMGVAAQNANQLSLALAGGAQLDALGSLFGLSRRAATRTVVDVALSGREGTEVPAGSSIVSPEGIAFALDEDVELPAEGEAETTASAAETGALVPSKVSASGAGWRPATGVVGWTGARMTALKSVGAEEEPDLSFRKRIRASRALGTSFSEAISGRIARIEGVSGAAVWENPGGSPLVIGDVELPPHSVAVVADMERDEATKLAVAEAIFATKPCGVAMADLSENGATPEEVVVTEPNYGGRYAMLFNYPKIEPYTLVVDVQKHRYGSATPLRDAVKAAVELWTRDGVPDVDAPGVGRLVSAAEAAAAVSACIPEIKVVDVDLFRQEYRVQDADGNARTEPLAPGNEIESRRCPIYEKPSFETLVRVYDEAMELVVDESDEVVLGDGEEGGDAGGESAAGEALSLRVRFRGLPFEAKRAFDRTVSSADSQGTPPSGQSGAVSLADAGIGTFFGRGVAGWSPQSHGIGDYVSGDGALKAMSSDLQLKNNFGAFRASGSIHLQANVANGVTRYYVTADLGNTNALSIESPGTACSVTLHPVFALAARFGSDRDAKFREVRWTHPRQTYGTLTHSVTLAVAPSWYSEKYAEDSMLVKVQAYYKPLGRYAMGPTGIEAGQTRIAAGQATGRGQTVSRKVWCVAKRSGGAYKVKVTFSTQNAADANRLLAAGARIVNIAY